MPPVLEPTRRGLPAASGTAGRGARLAACGGSRTATGGGDRSFTGEPRQQAIGQSRPEHAGPAVSAARRRPSPWRTPYGTRGR
jgi:hypothetical protein